MFAKFSAHGTLDGVNWSDADVRSGLPSGESYHRAQQIMAGLQGNANAIVQACGIHASDIESFYEWAKESKAQDLQRALTQYLYGRSGQWLPLARPDVSAVGSHLRGGTGGSPAARRVVLPENHRRHHHGHAPGKPEVPLGAAQRLGWL
jgi:hypothetical protein